MWVGLYTRSTDDVNWKSSCSGRPALSAPTTGSRLACQVPPAYNPGQFNIGDQLLRRQGYSPMVSGTCLAVDA